MLTVYNKHISTTFCNAAILVHIAIAKQNDTEQLWLNSMREELRCGGLHLETAESADLLQRRHDTAGGADDGPLASRARKVENTVGGLGKALEGRPERRTWCDTFLTPCSRSSTSKARS